MRERGLSVIPLAPRDKKPVAPWASFQEAHASRDNLVAWFGNGSERNIGIVTGAVSRIVAIDCDSAEAISWADTHLPPTPMATRTSKGGHRFYGYPGVPVRNQARIRTDDPRVEIDIRGDGGYVVGPGSVHPSGFVYERIGPWPPIDQLPKFDPAWLEPEPPPAVESRHVRRARERHDVHDHDRILKRARAYLDATPPAIEGQGGDTHTFSVCCRLVRGFDLSDADALDLLGDWNARCVPPWSAEELRAKIDGARKYGDEPIGGLLDQHHVRDAERSPHIDVEDVTDALLASDPSTQLKPNVLNLTDSGNAEYFAALYGSDARYDHRRQRWLLFHQHRFHQDDDAEIRRRAKATMRRRFQDAGALEDLHERARLARWAIASESRARLDALLYLAQAERPIADTGDNWDTDPMLAGAPNGVIDLRTGRLRPGRREDRITMSVAVPFDPDATCPRFERFIVEVFAGDRELVDFVQRAIGCSLTGDTSDQCLFLCYGKGGNGKGTLTQTLSFVFGDYAYTMPFSTVELHQRSAIPNDLAALVGRRFIAASETNDGTRLNESRIKALTGCDPLTARFLHAEFFTFRPVGKYWLSVNHKPIVRDDSHAFWRRMRLIPFTRTFVVNPALADELIAEASGILAWCVRGCLAWQERGLAPPATVTAATEEYEAESDPLRGFVDEVLAHEPKSEVQAAALYDAYGTWARAHGLSDRERMTATMFGRKMGERFPAKRVHGRKIYLDVARKAGW